MGNFIVTLFKNNICMVGVVFIICGFLLKTFPPKNINSFYGYRTPHSSQNQNTWDFSQKYFAKLLITDGIILFFIAFLPVFVPAFSNFSQKYFYIIIILAIVIPIVIAEAKLNKLFP